MSSKQVLDEPAQGIDMHNLTGNQANDATGGGGGGFERSSTLGMTPVASIPGGGHHRDGSDPACVGQKMGDRGVNTPGLDAGQGEAANRIGANGGLVGRCTSGYHPEDSPAALDRLMYLHSTPSPHGMGDDSADGPAVVHGDSPSARSSGVGGGPSWGCPSEEEPPARLGRLMPPCCTPSPLTTGVVPHGDPTGVVVPGDTPSASGFGVEGSNFAEGGFMGAGGGGLAAPAMWAMEQVIQTFIFACY